MSDNPTLSRIEQAIADVGSHRNPVDTVLQAIVPAIFEPWPDDRLTAEYLGTRGEPGDPLADLMAAELARRGIDL